MTSFRSQICITILSLLFAESISSKCLLKTDVFKLESDYSPLIYKSTISPYFLYPELNNPSCIFNENDSLENLRIHLTCSENFLQFSDSPDTTISSTYLTYDRTIERFSVNGFDNQDIDIIKTIECSGIAVPTMRNITSCHNFSKRKLYDFVVGYKTNESDFLTTYSFFSDIPGYSTHIWARVKLTAGIKNRPSTSGHYEYQKGLIFQQMSVDVSKVYNKEYQMVRFRQVLQDEELVEKYFQKGSNYLVKTQLISQDDLYYNSQRRSTFFYENTFPVWRSVAEGNWKLVNEAIHELAEIEVADLEICVGPINNLKIADKYMDYELGWRIEIPRILVKMAYDPFHVSRGMVYHVANDPHINATELYELMTGKNSGHPICLKFFKCEEIHPEFLIAERGLTYCCLPKDSAVWKDLMIIDA